MKHKKNNEKVNKNHPQMKDELSAKIIYADSYSAMITVERK